MKRIKVLFAAALSSALLLFGSFPSFAAYVHNSGDLQPYTYLFALALQVKGFSVTTYIDTWYDAYGMYLERKGDAPALARYRALQNFSWGQTYTGMDAFCQDVHAWLADCRQTLFDGSPGYFSPATPPSPIAWPSGNDNCCIQTTPYNIYDYQNNSIVTSGNYNYLFSDMYMGNNGYVYKRNVYSPKGVRFFGVISGVTNYTSRISVKFYKIDSSSASGYSPCNVYSINEWYDPVTHARISGNGASYHSEWNWTTVDAKLIMNLPIDIIPFGDRVDAYVKGQQTLLVQKNIFPVLGGYGGNLTIFDRFELESINSQVVLPASSSAGKTNLSSLYKMSPADYVDKLHTVGVDIAWKPYPYTVEYYYDGSLLHSEALSVPPDNNTVSSVPDRPEAGYRLTASPYSPALPFAVTQNSPTIRVDYESWKLPYTVEYYQDGKLSGTAHGEVSSVSPIVESVELSPPAGFNAKAEGLPFTVTEDSNVIKVYYTYSSVDAVLSGVDNTISSLKGFLGPALPLGLGAVTAGGSIWTFVKIFKRIVTKT